MEGLIKRVSVYSGRIRSFTREFEMLFKDFFLSLLEFSLFTLTLAKAQKALKEFYYWPASDYFLSF